LCLLGFTVCVTVCVTAGLMQARAVCGVRCRANRACVRSLTVLVVVESDQMQNCGFCAMTDVRDWGLDPGFWAFTRIFASQFSRITSTPHVPGMIHRLCNPARGHESCFQAGLCLTERRFRGSASQGWSPTSMLEKSTLLSKVRFSRLLKRVH
jgi:hypothetical protein